MLTENIILFGGAFDPIHYGHLLLAERAKEKLGMCNEVIFIPSGDHPYKKNITTFKHRYDMTRLATSLNLDFKVSDVEDRLSGISYTIHTVEYLQRQLDDERGGLRAFYWLIGPDNLEGLRNWHRIDELVNKCCFIISLWEGDNRFRDKEWYKRDEFKYYPFYKEIAQHMVKVVMPTIEIRSTEIRERISQGKSINYMTPDEVRYHIGRFGLYTDNPQDPLIPCESRGCDTTASK